jgi:hypothetical protein
MQKRNKSSTKEQIESKQNKMVEGEEQIYGDNGTKHACKKQQG